MSDKQTSAERAKEWIEWTRSGKDVPWATHAAVLGLFTVIRELQDRVEELEIRAAIGSEKA